MNEAFSLSRDEDWRPSYDVQMFLFFFLEKQTIETRYLMLLSFAFLISLALLLACFDSKENDIVQINICMIV